MEGNGYTKLRDMTCCCDNVAHRLWPFVNHLGAIRQMTKAIQYGVAKLAKNELVQVPEAIQLCRLAHNSLWELLFRAVGKTACHKRILTWKLATWVIFALAQCCGLTPASS